MCAAKTAETSTSTNLPGSVRAVAAECDAVAAEGAEALACVMNLLDERSIVACVETTVKKYGRLDILINNASALWWQDVVDTPTKKYDLIQGVNARGAFVMTRECLGWMKRGGYGRVISMGPPLPTCVIANTRRRRRITCPSAG